MSNKGVTVIDVRKPNSSGADFSVDKINRMFGMLGEYVGISTHENVQLFVNANRWTAVALENQGCVEIVNNTIVGMPQQV